MLTWLYSEIIYTMFLVFLLQMYIGLGGKTHRFVMPIWCRVHYGLLSVIRRKKCRNYGEYLHKYPNLLNKDFSVQRLNQKCVTDISYIQSEECCISRSLETCVITVLLPTKPEQSKMLILF